MNMVNKDIFENNELQKLYEQHKENIKDYPTAQQKEKFQAECNRFSKIAKNYSPLCKGIYEKLIPDIARKEYSTGGELLTRGYYCESPVLDIITGNRKRGKLLKRINSRSKPTYKYCFDKNNKLILINYLHSDCAEILEYENNTVVGITFSLTTNEIICVTECVYDSRNRIVSFITAHSAFNDCSMNEIHKEAFIYNEKGLDTAEVFDYLYNEDCSNLNYDKYRFKHDEEGFLSEYTCETSMFKDDTYKVYVKRKV